MVALCLSFLPSLPPSHRTPHLSSHQHLKVLNPLSPTDRTMDSYLVDPATFPTSPRRSAPREPTHGHKRGEPSTSSQRSKESRPDIELGYSHTRFTAHSFTPPPDHGVRNDLTAAAGEYLGTVSGLCFLWLDF